QSHRGGAPTGKLRCRSTRPGCEQRSVPGGSMGGPSCCTTDGLVHVLPGVAPARVGVARVRGAPGGTRCLGTSSPRAAIELDEPTFLWRRLVGAPAPGCEPPPAAPESPAHPIAPRRCSYGQTPL